MRVPLNGVLSLSCALSVRPLHPHRSHRRQSPGGSCGTSSTHQSTLLVGHVGRVAQQRTRRCGRPKTAPGGVGWPAGDGGWGEASMCHRTGARGKGKGGLFDCRGGGGDQSPPNRLCVCGRGGGGRPVRVFDRPGGTKVGREWRPGHCLVWRTPTPPAGGGGVRGQKIVCVPKIGLQFPAPLINFIFCRVKFF